MTSHSFYMLQWRNYRSHRSKNREAIQHNYFTAYPLGWLYNSKFIMIDTGCTTCFLKVTIIFENDSSRTCIRNSAITYCDFKVRWSFSHRSEVSNDGFIRLLFVGRNKQFWVIFWMENLMKFFQRKIRGPKLDEVFPMAMKFFQRRWSFSCWSFSNPPVSALIRSCLILSNHCSWSSSRRLTRCPNG